MNKETRNYKILLWREPHGKVFFKGEMHGAFVTENISGISPDMSFLEMLDILNDRILSRNDHPVCFESDCREGICGACSLVINGVAHGRQTGTTTCQLHMRSFKSGSTIVVEPFRARSFPVIRDLVVDRSALDRIMQAGGYISVNVGSAPDAHSILVDKKSADQAFEAAACIGCGACVAMCKNSSAMLFVGAKISQLSKLPQGQPERYERVKRMVEQMQVEGFGGCSNTMACEAVCPKGITTKVISELNWEFLKMTLKS